MVEGRLRSDLRIPLKLILIAMANLVLMSCVPKAHVHGCYSLGSGLRISISSPDEAWLFTWSGGGIEKQKSVYSGQDFEFRLNVFRSTGDERSRRLPQDLLGGGMHLEVPFAMSHKGEMLISSIYPEGHTLLTSKTFAIIDLKSRKLLRVIDAEYFVRSLACSPTDKYFAVLVAQNVSSQKWKDPLDWLGELLGHPSQYYTLYVDIYNLEGEMVCRKLLIEKLRSGRGYLDWE